MLQSLFKRGLILTGNRHLIPFLDGLTYLGRPSQVPFPTELLEQGLAIVLSGLNNTLAIQSNPDWVWPYWVERQISPEGDEFIPTAFNLIKSNLTCRNWTSLGLEDSPREAMLDPVGMLTLRPYGFSLFPYVRYAGSQFFPPRLRAGVRQFLIEGDLPGVITEYSVHPHLQWRSEALPLRHQGEEILHFTHCLRNQSELHLSLQFGIALRPYNPLMVSHINAIVFEKNVWHINGKPAWIVDEKPHHIQVSDRHHGDPLVKNNLMKGLQALKSRSGIACGLCEWNVELPAGQEKIFTTLGFMGEHASVKVETHQQGLQAGSVTLQRIEGLERLRQKREEGMNLTLPDKRLERAFRAVKGHLHVFDDGDHFSPGTFLYHNHWFRDAAFVAMAFDHLGWSAAVAEKFPHMLRRQDKKGFFRSQNGEWDSNGQAIWTLVQHVRRGGNPQLLETVFPAILAGARWIARMREGQRVSPCPHYGLLPAGFSAEHFGPNDHYWWDNLWSLAGLESALWAARSLTQSEAVAWLEDELQDYRSDCFNAMQLSAARLDGSVLPCSPYRSLDSAAIGNLVGFSPLGVLPNVTPWLRGTVEWLLQNNLRDGLFFQKIVHTGLNPYLTVQLARTLITLRDTRSQTLVQALLDKATQTFTWPEALHPKTFGGCMGDGDHGWSAAEFLNLVRAMLIEDHAGALVLLAGVPAEWFQPGLDLQCLDAPTVYGRLSLKIRQSPDSLDLEWSLKRAPHQDAAQVTVLLPSSLFETNLVILETLSREGEHFAIPLKEKEGQLNLPLNLLLQSVTPGKKIYV